jgi:hypothetical protein
LAAEEQVCQKAAKAVEEQIRPGAAVLVVEQTHSEAAHAAVCFDLFRFVSVKSKHRNSVFDRNETFKTNVLFQIVPKLVSPRVSVVSKRN